MNLSQKSKFLFGGVRLVHGSDPDATREVYQDEIWNTRVMDEGVGGFVR